MWQLTWERRELCVEQGSNSVYSLCFHHQLLPKHSVASTSVFSNQHGILFCLLPLHQQGESCWNPCHRYNSALPTSPGHPREAWCFQPQSWGCLPHQDGPYQLQKSHCLQQLQVTIIKQWTKWGMCSNHILGVLVISSYKQLMPCDQSKVLKLL